MGRKLRRLFLPNAGGPTGDHPAGGGDGQADLIAGGPASVLFAEGGFENILHYRRRKPGGIAVDCHKEGLVAEDLAAKGNQVIGSAGPTTSYRMDAYSPTMIKLGQRGMIGKGKRSPEVIAAMKEHGAVYFGAIGGAGALLSRCIKKAEIIAYEDLGAEALRRLEVEDLPAFVIIDCEGNNLYETGPKEYLESIR